MGSHGVPGEAKNDDDPDKSVAGVAKTMRKGDYLKLRSAYETACGEVEDDKVPGKLWLEDKLQEVEDGEVEPDKLDEVVTKDEELPSEDLDVYIEQRRARLRQRGPSGLR